MPEYNLNLNVKIEAEDLAIAYLRLAEILTSVKNLGEITKVDIAEPKPNGFPGHTSGCRMSKTRNAGVACTCGPVPR